MVRLVEQQFFKIEKEKKKTWQPLWCARPKNAMESFRDGDQTIGFSTFSFFGKLIISLYAASVLPSSYDC